MEYALRFVRPSAAAWSVALLLGSFACGSTSDDGAFGTAGGAGGAAGASSGGNAGSNAGSGGSGPGGAGAGTGGAQGDAGHAGSGGGAHMDAGSDLGDGAPRDGAPNDGAPRDSAPRDAATHDRTDDARDAAQDAARDVDGSARGDDAGTSHRSAGCGRAASGTSSYVRQTITVGGTSREYYVWVPRSYDANRAYPIVFRWHGSTGNGLSGGLEIEASSGENALIASPSGIGGKWDLSPSGIDVALFDALLTQLEDSYCIDPGRVFSYGFSAGGGFTNLLGCVRSNVVRGVAPVEGFAPVTTCPGRVAAWITHSADDTVEPLALGTQVRGLFLSANGCTMTTMPVSPSPCVRYQGCAPGYPVDWCQTSGSHNPQGSFTGPGAWSFFDSLR